MFFNNWLISKEQNKKKKLPVGLTEFHEWSEKIIGLAGLSATVNSQKHTLASMIMQLKPTEAFQSDAFFVHSLLKAASNQVALEYAQKIYPQEKARLLAEQQKQNQAAVTPSENGDAQILEIKRV